MYYTGGSSTRWNCLVHFFQHLVLVLSQDAANVGDEGGFAPNVKDNNEALDLVMEAIKSAGHEGKTTF